jgi:hypothetical protein
MTTRQELITETRFVLCQQCLKPTSATYCIMGRSHGIEVCFACVCAPCGSFPKGKDVTLPCPKCSEPEIHWFTQKTYGVIQDACDLHWTHDDDDDVTFNYLFN